MSIHPLTGLAQIFLFLFLGIHLILMAQRADKQLPNNNKSVIKCTTNVPLSWIKRQCQLSDILAEFLWKWILRSQKGTHSIKWHKTYQTSWVTNAKTGGVASIGRGRSASVLLPVPLCIRHKGQSHLVSLFLLCHPSGATFPRFWSFSLLSS